MNDYTLVKTITAKIHDIITKAKAGSEATYADFEIKAIRTSALDTISYPNTLFDYVIEVWCYGNHHCPVGRYLMPINADLSVLYDDEDEEDDTHYLTDESGEPHMTEDLERFHHWLTSAIRDAYESTLMPYTSRNQELSWRYRNRHVEYATREALKDIIPTGHPF